MTLRAPCRPERPRRALPRRRAAARVVLGGVIGVVGIATAPAASAHDELRDSTPPADSVLTEAPPVVELQFTGDLVSASVVVVDGCGRPVGSVASTEDRTVRAELDLADVAEPRGAWTVTYLTIGGDGHEVEGDLTFDVAGTPDCSAGPASTAETSAAADGAAEPGSQPATDRPEEAGATAPVSSSTDEPTVPMVPLLAGGVVLLAGAGAVISSRRHGRRADAPRA